MTALQESYDSREAKGSEKPEARVKFQKLLFFGQVRLSEEHQQVKREWRQLFDKWFEHELLRKPSPDGKLPASPVEAFKKWHEYYEAKRTKAVLDLLCLILAQAHPWNLNPALTDHLEVAKQRKEKAGHISEHVR